MRYILSAALMLILTNKLFAQLSQKKEFPIGTSIAFNHWPQVSGGQITNDGNYASYDVSSYASGKNLLVVRAVSNKWECKYLTTQMPAKFTADSKKVIFLATKDTLTILNLGTQKRQALPHVRQFALTGNEHKEKLLYLSTLGSLSLVIRDLKTGIENRIENISNYLINDQGTVAVLVNTCQKDAIELQWLNIESGNCKTIWTGTSAYNFKFDKRGCKLAFLSKTNGTSGRANNLWYYQPSQKNAELLANNYYSVADSGMKISDQQLEFSNDGNKIFLGLEEKLAIKPEPAPPGVDVWSYKDLRMQSNQLVNLREEPVYAGIYNIPQHKIVKLQNPGEEILRGNDEFAIVYDQNKLDRDQTSDRPPFKPFNIFLVSTSDGSRKLIEANVQSFALESLWFSSPNGRWLVYYDKSLQAYRSYDVQRGLTKTLTKGVKNNFLDELTVNSSINHYTSVVGAAGWTHNDEAILIYDNYDIWKIDPTGKIAPINLTNGYGTKHHIKIRLAYQQGVSHGRLETGYVNERLIFSMFNDDNKNDGFCKISFEKPLNPKILSSGSWYVSGTTSALEEPAGNDLIRKAGNKNKWLINKQSFNDAPNYFVTNDFIKFRRISNFQPQQPYKWLSAELIHWKQPNGINGTAILYKPECFDPYKKYPVIFQYYEHRSNTLNFYNEPCLTYQDVNIPFMVNRGYVVCVPDIDFKIGIPGASAANSVVSAANYLKTKPWVDSMKLGLDGHSFGGFETNYIITHSQLFSAAVEAAGPSDFVNLYGGLFGFDAFSWYFENGQGRIGSTLWQRPDLYVANSPIFNLDKVVTPLLIMHNIGDIEVPFEQGVQMFSGLRRLGKPVWMLQYDRANHTLTDDFDAVDYTTRLTQFFDHYLKGAPPPKWMTQGIPAKMKGINDGLELDTSGRQP